MGSLEVEGSPEELGPSEVVGPPEWVGSLDGVGLPETVGSAGRVKWVLDTLMQSKPLK